MNKDLVKYYKDRAMEYEKIYAKPERQEDLKEASALLQELFRGNAVLEIACGTGYWTEQIAKTANSVIATDINDAVIEISKQKDYGNANVSFEVADIYKLGAAKKNESLFGGFIWSHIPLQGLDRFIDTVNNLVTPGGLVVMMDNMYVEGSNHLITQTDEQGNTYQMRKLEDGTTHLVLKNFPSETYLKEKLKGKATDIKVINLPYYWILTYKTLNNE